MKRPSVCTLIKIPLISAVALLIIIQGCKPNFDGNREDGSITEESFDTIADIQLYYETQSAKLELDNHIPKDVDEKYELITVSSFGPVRAKVFYRKDSTLFVCSKSTDVSVGDRDVYHRIIEKRYWNIVTNMIDEFDYWKTPRFEEPVAEYLDGYTMMISAEKNVGTNIEMKRIILRPNPMYDKIGALGNYLWELEEDIYGNDTLNGGNKFLKEDDKDES